MDQRILAPFPVHLPAHRLQTPACAWPKPDWIFCPVFVRERLNKEKKHEGVFLGGLVPLLQRERPDFQTSTVRGFVIGFAL